MRSRCAHAAAMAVTESEEVFVARTHWSPPYRRLEGPRKSRRFSAEVFHDRLDHEAAIAKCAEIVPDRTPLVVDPPEHRVRRVARHPLLLDRPLQGRGDRGRGLGHYPFLRVSQHDPMASGRRDLRDPAAHGSCPDNSHGSGDFAERLGLEQRHSHHHRPVKVGVRFSMKRGHALGVISGPTRLALQRLLVIQLRVEIDSERPIEAAFRQPQSTRRLRGETASRWRTPPP